jgi:hypothetical protein
MTAKPVLVVALIAALAVVLFLGYCRKNAQARTWASTDEFIQRLASEAVKDAERENHIQLDYTVESIKTVDKILGHVHDMYIKNPSSVSVNGLGSSYGAYVGEVIRRSEPGARWERDDPVAGEKSYPLIWGAGAGHSYPLGWCQKRIINGDEDNLWVKYSALKQRYSLREQPSQPPGDLPK